MYLLFIDELNRSPSHSRAGNEWELEGPVW